MLAVDYRGYGLSTGTPSEHGLYRDVDATLRFVDELPLDPVAPLIYWGRSLGTVMAAYAASRRAPTASCSKRASRRCARCSKPIL